MFKGIVALAIMSKSKLRVSFLVQLIVLEMWSADLKFGIGTLLLSFISYGVHESSQNVLY